MKAVIGEEVTLVGRVGLPKPTPVCDPHENVRNQ